MPDYQNNSLKPPEQSSSRGWWLAILLVLLLAVGAWFWFPFEKSSGSLPVATDAAPPQDVVPTVPTAPDPASGPENPIEALGLPDETLPPLDSSDDYLSRVVASIFGADKSDSLLQLDGFARRVVATVDNLPREQSPARMWPVQPTPERFTVNKEGQSQTIAQNNAARYNAFVLAMESVDMKRVAGIYAQLYPLFQKAYEELGYPGKYFNDRLVAVIDHLLQAPEPEGPLHVTLTEVKGDFPSTRPWVRYEFADPQLEALSSGQKIMVRVGLVNERRLKQRLRSLRAAVAAGAVAKAAKP